MEGISLIDDMFDILAFFLDLIGHHYLFRSATHHSPWKGYVPTPDTPAPIVMTLSLRLLGSLSVIFGTSYTSEARIHDSFSGATEPIMSYDLLRILSDYWNIFHDEKRKEKKRGKVAMHLPIYLPI